MVETTKLSYEAPATKVIELSAEGYILQASGGPYNNPFGDEKKW